jgi:glycosyltransferase involved in cell wall biosynthesis
MKPGENEMNSDKNSSMDSSQLVSILIPVYNREKFIAECIQSALDQTYSKIEIIVVDNVSTDATWQICKEFAMRNQRVRVFQNETNIGPVRNWIRCAQEAHGEFSKVLFSDDLLNPDCIRRMVARFVPDVAFVVCAALVGASRAASQIYYAGNKPLLTWSEYLPRQLDWRLPVSPGAVLLRTADLRKNLCPGFPTSVGRPFDRNGAGPDAMIMLQTAREYGCVACISDPLVFFRDHPDSFTISTAHSSLRDSYTSAFAYFLKQNDTWIHWLQYVFFSWLGETIHRRSWQNFKQYLRTYEGTGLFKETLMAALLAPFWLGGAFFGRIWTRMASRAGAPVATPE